jgi:membrane protease YdiL (CAAX protease family)
MRSLFSLNKKPWLFSVLLMIFWVVGNILFGIALTLILGLESVDQLPPPWVTVGAHLLTVFVVAVYVLGFPEKGQKFRDFLAEIRLTKMRPLPGLLLLGLSCYLILALSQAAGVLVFRLTQGLPVDWQFIRSAFVLANELPPRSNSWLISLISIFEEITYRGVILAIFLRFYSKPKSILFTAIVFGLMHILTLVNGASLAWAAGTVLWAFILGLFYGYITIKTDSLLPAMLVHYLGNLFVAAINAYIQNNASVPLQAVYGIVFTLGIIPAALMALWTRFFSARWPGMRGS